jgi:hypothetical protein
MIKIKNAIFGGQNGTEAEYSSSNLAFFHPIHLAITAAVSSLFVTG